MSKYKINLFCGDNLEPSSSALNATKHVQWVYDGSGEVNIYVSQRALDALNDTSGKPTYIWLLESKQIIPQYYQWIIDNYEFVTSRVDGIFSCDKELCAKYPKISYSLINAVPWVQDRKVHEKTKLVSMIASNKRMCEGHARRLQFVDKFRDKLDFYGRGFNEISCKEDGLRDYMFSVGIENAVYDTYFTEKLTDCFACGTIPIFYGCKGVTEYFNEDGIIFLDDDFDLSMLTKDLYYSKMDVIKDNFERSINFPVAEDYLYLNYFK
ncbi:MAG: hypothetical protein CM15mV20_2120 [uncultured marine virus]|jgi:hypothetical protein|nr:MAG: hypothetical protein CM15mV20_2120 [uncultured marine virus]|tara:strand:+ start:244 stop:1044 length:801 start_codon:yes stop_codon:yes gene_type:complete